MLYYYTFVITVKVTLGPLVETPIFAIQVDRLFSPVN